MADVTFDAGKLNVVPEYSIPAVVHCSYGDEGTVVKFEVWNGLDKFVFPSDNNVIAEVYGHRPDGANWGPFDVDVDPTESTVSFKLNKVMTSFAGGSLAEIRFTVLSGSSREASFGSVQFGIAVENAIWDSKVAYASDSASVYKGLTDKVSTLSEKQVSDKEELTGKIEANKTETDNTISELTKTVTDNKTETDKSISDLGKTTNDSIAEIKARVTEEDTLSESMLSFSKVDALPTSGIAGIVYLVANGSNWNCSEWKNNAWTTAVSSTIDLTTLSRFNANVYYLYLTR